MSKLTSHLPEAIPNLYFQKIPLSACTKEDLMKIVSFLLKNNNNKIEYYKHIEGLDYTIVRFIKKHINNHTFEGEVIDSNVYKTGYITDTWILNNFKKCEEL